MKNNVDGAGVSFFFVTRSIPNLGQSAHLIKLLNLNCTEGKKIFKGPCYEKNIAQDEMLSVWVEFLNLCAAEWARLMSRNAASHNQQPASDLLFYISGEALMLRALKAADGERLLILSINK